jgi:hypothetical protein
MHNEWRLLAWPCLKSHSSNSTDPAAAPHPPLIETACCPPIPLSHERALGSTIGCRALSNPAQTNPPKLQRSWQAFKVRSLDKMAANCEELRGQVEAFKEVAPLAAALRAPGMRPRHWEQLSAQVSDHRGLGRT